jgi:hypothetical protein
MSRSCANDHTRAQDNASQNHESEWVGIALRCFQTLEDLNQRVVCIGSGQNNECKERRFNALCL